ncbi:hypothetical protein PF011_g30009 [Phytophthora fragariae]|uniref:Uncharacterized protein n=2 Tax=Phytophthora fragariae TaxID=53985 RepID=A0A6A3GUW0_9STRA|nr:hypothetical protein PF011_g30009 [Phytophthora fragariae]
MEVRVPRWQPDLLAPPPVLHAHFNATTASGDSRLIIVSLFVAGARRPLRALLDSGAANNFFRASCLSILPAGVPVRDLSGDVVVKLADGKPRRVARRELSLSYTFDGFHSNDNFIVFDMNYAFDCILDIPWLVRYQPQIDWLARSVKRRQDFDVTEVLTHLLVAPRDWPHVTVVDGASTTHVVHRASDGPLCPTCAVLLTGDEDEEPARGRASERRAVEHPWLPYVKEVVEQWFSPSNEAVEQRFPSTNEAVEQWFPPANEAVEQGLPHYFEAVEQGLPHDDVAGEQELRPRVNGAAENELSRLEEGEASSGESDTSISSRGSRRTKTSRRSKRRLRPRRAVDLPSTPTDSVCTVEYVDGAPNRTRVIEVGSPPRDAKSITSVPGLSWKNFLRDLDEVIAGIRDESTYSSFGSAVEEGHDQTLEDTWIGARSLLLQPQQQNWADVLVRKSNVYESMNKWAVCVKMFPTLFPGCSGGPTEPRLSPMSVRKWILRCLQIHDHRFETHYAFMLLTFDYLAYNARRTLNVNMNIKRQALNAAEIPRATIREAIDYFNYLTECRSRGIKILYLQT